MSVCVVVGVPAFLLWASVASLRASMRVVAQEKGYPTFLLSHKGRRRLVDPQLCCSNKKKTEHKANGRLGVESPANSTVASGNRAQTKARPNTATKEEETTTDTNGAFPNQTTRTSAREPANKMQNRIDTAVPRRRGRFPEPPPTDQKRGLSKRLILVIAANIAVVGAFWVVAGTSPSPAFFAAICLAGLSVGVDCLGAVFKQGEDRAVAALALNVDRTVRTYTEGATPMFDVDEAVAHALADPWCACGATAARLALYVMYSLPDEACGSTDRAVYTRDQAERIWPRLFDGPTAQQDRRRLFHYTVRIPTTRRVGTSHVGDVCVISVYTALHPVDAFAYALDAGVAAQMAADRLIQSRHEERERRDKEQRAICREEERQRAQARAERVVQPPSLFSVPPMTH